MAQSSPTEARQWSERRNSVFPGGVLGTFDLAGQEVVIHHGEGPYVYSTDGRRYIDYVLGSGPMLLGHAHPAVVQAIETQARLGTTYYAVNEPAVELAEEILSVFPSPARLMYCSTGAEATFYALRLARAYTGRQLVVKFAGAYHGHHDYGMVEPWARRWGPGQGVELGSAGVPPQIAETVLIAPYNDPKALRLLFERHGESIAAVILEPYQRVIEPEPSFLDELTGLARSHGALVVADEVVTGFRFHYGLAQSQFGFAADLTSLGKVIGGGLPLAAVAGRPDVMELADVHAKGDTNYVYVSGTLNGNALAAAAGLATLRELKKAGVYDTLNASGERLRRNLVNALTDHEFTVLAAGRGPMFHPVFAASAPRSAADVAATDRSLAKQFATHLIDLGLFINPSQRSYVSFAHGDEELEQTSRLFFEAALALRNNLGNRSP